MSTLVIVLVVVAIIIAIALFIEKGYNERHSDISFIAPLISAKIDKDRLGLEGDVYIYNSRETTRGNVLRNVSEEEQLNYVDKPILEHSSSRITKPFATAIAEKSSFASEPITYLYETMTNMVSISNAVKSIRSGADAQYRILAPSSAKMIAFIDGGNIYLRVRK